MTEVPTAVAVIGLVSMCVAAVSIFGWTLQARTTRVYQRLANMRATTAQDAMSRADRIKNKAERLFVDYYRAGVRDALAGTVIRDSQGAPVKPPSPYLNHPVRLGSWASTPPPPKFASQAEAEAWLDANSATSVDG